MSDAADLLDAVKNGDVERARGIARRNPAAAGERAATGESAILTALYHGHRDLAAELADGAGPLDVFAAAALGRTDALDRAVEAGHQNDVAYDGWTPLHLAAFFGQEDAAAQLLENGADLDALSRNSMRNTPLHAATAGRHSRLALLLIARGAAVSVRDAGGHTPLHIAAENGLADVVRALLERGADPYAVDGEDRTPMARAAAHNRNEIIDLLNQAGER